MKRQNSSSTKSILHFFKSVPRASQESLSSPATADASADDVSQPSTSTGSALPENAQSSAPGPSVSFNSTTSTIADAPTTDSVMTSVETLPPTTSQTSATSGASKRVLSHGQQVVLNSDSDSDSMGELDFGIPAPRPKLPTYTARSSRRIGFGEPELRRPPKSAKSTGKRSFNQLLETAQKNLDTERKIQERKADLEKVDEEPTPVIKNLDKDTLKHAIQDGEDSDQADRLYKAMQRTNESQTQAAYHFFKDTPTFSLTQPFPQRSLPDHGWTACLEEPSTRNQAFMAGFAHQIFRLQALPQELAAWMIDQICLSGNDALNQKYLEIFQTHGEQLQKQLSPERLDIMFKSIGAQVDCLDTDAEMSPSESRATKEERLPPSLKRIAAMLASAAPCYTIIPSFLSRVTNPLLQANLVHAFPTRSPLTAYLQRHLALSFLLHPLPLDVPLADPQLPALIYKYLETSSHWHMSKETNYSFVAARLALLDIAIGPGLMTVPYVPLVSPPPSDAGSSPPSVPTPASSEVKEFNKEVDTLAQHIKLLGNSIIETGAALDLTILEAKERCERLFWRLQHAVRIGGKKAENVFGDGDDSRQVKVRKFFQPLPKKRVSKDSIFDQDDDIELPT